MIDRRLAVGLLLVLAPTIAGAQRGGDRGTRAPNWDQLAKGDPTTILTRKEVEAMDPVRRLVDRRKELKLTEAQVARLKAHDDSGKTRDEPLFHTMDSLRKEMKPVGEMDDVQRLRLQVVRRAFAESVFKIRANYDAAGQSAMPVLDESQRTAAEELLAKQRAEADEKVQEKLSAGRGGARPGGPPGGAPPGGRPPRPPRS